MDESAPSDIDEVPLCFPDGTRAWAAPLTPQGMHVRTAARLRVGQVISVQLQTAVANLAVTAHGYVVIANGTPGGSTEATVRFIDLRTHRTP